MNVSNNIKNIENEEVSIIYKIFEEIYLKAPPILKDVSKNSMGFDNRESVYGKIDFKKIDTKFKNKEYCYITDAIKDIRTVFLNCYLFYGTRSDHTKKILKLEELLEEKISCLDKKYRSLADVKHTFSSLNMKGKSSSKLRCPKDCYDSVLLQSVAHCRPERLKKYDETLSTTLTTDKDNAHILEDILIWENEINFNDIFHQYISSMWELPEIGNFVAILFKKLNLDIIKQGEIERMFIIPKESTTMSKIMTTLLMPVRKTKYNSPVMPYKVWSKKLSKKVSGWFKVYHTKKQNKVSVMNLIGIHPDFWSVVNEKNPLIEKDYIELSYFIKVWLVKGLCDHVTVKFKKINDIVANCNERQCTIWKNDLETEEYFFFNSMPDFRVYYYNIPYDDPCLEFLESIQNVKEVVRFEDNPTVNGLYKKQNNFKLVADSVEGLRSFVNKMDMEGTSVPANLINSLENFIVKIESEEYNYIAMNNDSRLKLYKDWISYPIRIQKDNDISFWEEKDSKSKTQAINEELIIVEKRPRKLIVKQNFDIIESDEYVSENDKLLSDFTDSEDDWGALNQPKKKVKQSLQTPSKSLPKLEKQVSRAEKMLKYGPSNLSCLLKEKDSKSMARVEEPLQTFSKHLKVKEQLPKAEKMPKYDANHTDEMQLCDENKMLKHVTNKVCKTKKKNKLIKSIKLLKTQNEVKCSNNSNIFVNVHKQRLVHTYNSNKIIDNDYGNEKVVLINSDTEENQKSPNGLRQIGVINLDEDIHNACEMFNDNFESSISTFTENKNKKTNIQNNYKQLESTSISIEDDNIIISDDEDELQLISITDKPKHSKTNLNKSYNSVSANRQITPSKYIQHQAPSSITQKLSNNVTIMPSNVNTLKIMSNNVQLFSTNVKLECSPLKTDLSKSYNSVSANRQITPSKYIQHQAPSSITQPLSNNVTIMPSNVNTSKSMSNNVQLFSTNVKPECSPLKTDLNKSYNSVSANRQITPSKYIQHQAPSSITQKLSNNVTIMPSNVNTSKSMSNNVQLFSTNVKPECSPLKTDLNKSYKSVSANRQITPSKYIQHQAPSSITQKLFNNVTIMPSNVNTSKSMSNNVQLFSTNVKPECSPLKTDLNKSYKSVSANRQITPSKYIQHRSPSSITQKLSNNVTIMPSNVNTSKSMSNNVQLFSTNVKPECSPLKTDLNKSYKSVSANRQITPSKYIQHRAPSSITQKLSNNITIMPSNVNTSKSMSNNVQLFSTNVKPECLPLKADLSKSYNSVSANRQITPSKYNQHQIPSSIIQKLSKNVTIMQSNVNIPKGIDVTMVKIPQTKMDSNFNSKKRKGISSSHLQDNFVTINVKCKLISMSNFNGEVKFFAKLPNGTVQDVANELINKYLNQNNNQLPEFWLVPLTEVAKQ